MLIIGAKGLAKEVLEIFHQNNQLEGLCFYDDVSTNLPGMLFDKFPILTNMNEVENLFKTDARFIIAIGNSNIRLQMYQKFTNIGGRMVSAISPYAIIGHYQTKIGEGCIVMANSFISNSVNIGMGCLINPNCSISHDAVIGNFVEISPGVNITGGCKVGSLSTIGTNAAILPRVELAENVVVGAGAVVLKNIETAQTVVGVPARPVSK